MLFKRAALSVALFMASIFFVACTSPENRIFKNGLKEQTLGHFHIAVSEFEKVIKRIPEHQLSVRAAKEAARITLYDLKDYKKSVEFNKFIVLKSQDFQDRILAQKNLAMLYFDNLQNYNQAIIEYTKLLQMSLTPADEALYRTNIARAYYYLGDLGQAENEIKEVLKLEISSENRFAAILLSGNLYLSRKDYTRAVDVFKKLASDYPEKAINENIYQNLAVCYEENKDYTNAIKTLEYLVGKYNPPEYIELRIKRLKERQKNQPGARGYKK